MGCGGSKDEVATGNAVATKSLQRGMSFEKVESTNGQIEGIKFESLEKLPIPKGVDETTVGGTDSKEAVVGKLISKESPDLYFSTRKDETAVAAVDIAVVDPPEVKDAVVVKDEEAPLTNAVLSPIDNEKSDAEDIQVSKEETVPVEVNDSDSTVEEKKN